MSIGYACLTVGVLDSNQKSCTLKNASDERLLEIIGYNLNSLENIIDYNIENNIKLFRISSDLIPFGSSPVNKLPWWEIFSNRFIKIGEKIRNNRVRVSMHPGQYTVLNSPDTDVVKRAIEDLNYHARVLDSLGVDEKSKIVLHIGGIYNDKKQAINRFIINYGYLDNKVKKRLVIENDDKSYNIFDVLNIASNINTPVVFDNLHNRINCYDENKSDFYWIDECKRTWCELDGNQKIHYSQQDPLKKPGSHSNTIRINEFMDFYKDLDREDIDIMLEVKDKNLSAVKCINCTSNDKKIKALENEWSRYKYKVLECSHQDYNEIRKLLKNKNDYPAVYFYNIIEGAIQKEITIGDSINALQHVWGYFKDTATDKEKVSFFKSIEDYKQGKVSVNRIKNQLFKMSVKYNQTYLLNSYYFYI